jgi:hypothetical protein
MPCDCSWQLAAGRRGWITTSFIKRGPRLIFLRVCTLLERVCCVPYCNLALKCCYSSSGSCSCVSPVLSRSHSSAQPWRELNAGSCVSYRQPLSPSVAPPSLAPEERLLCCRVPPYTSYLVHRPTTGELEATAAEHLASSAARRQTGERNRRLSGLGRLERP